MGAYRFALIIILSFTYSFAQVASIKSFSGDAFVKHNKTSSKLTLGAKLFKNDIIITKENGSVSIVFNDGSLLSLGENSFLTINEYIFKPLKNDFDFNLTLKSGTAVFESGKIGKLAPESFKMNFPKGIIGIRGTKFLLRVD